MNTGTKAHGHEGTEGSANARLPLRASVPSRLRASLPAFTLIELMISIALVLILMIGINQVFKLTGEATGAGQAQAEGIRNSRAMQGVIGRDIAAMSSDGPCILLRSSVTPAFRSRADELSDRDVTAADTPALRQQHILTTDRSNPLNNSETDSEDKIPLTEYGNRSHRTDIFSFFASDLYPRQTGNDGTFVADMSSYEVWVWYGHLWLPTDSSADIDRYYADGSGRTVPTFPGAGTFSGNPNNIYGSQFALGRVVMSLRDKNGTAAASPTPTGQTPTDIWDRPNTSGGARQDYIEPGNGFTLAPLQVGLAPYTTGSLSTKITPGSPRVYRLQEGRYDLANTTMATFKTALNSIAANTNWWGPLMLDCRFQCDPYLIDASTGNRALNSRTMAGQAPYFVGHCSQFIVEYAGDFVAQDNLPSSPTYGQITATGVPWTPTGTTNAAYVSDGQVDYVVVGAGANAKRQIRWYGLPRDADGDGVIPGWVAAIGTDCNKLPDVVPLRDVVRTATGYNAFNGAPFEKLTGFNPPPPAALDPTIKPKSNYADPSTGMGPGEYYTCAWRDTDLKPALIRILVTIDDPTGRLADGQTFEYVFKVP